jgi:pimeloyl-ACP methyl ester carboxylesterase
LAGAAIFNHLAAKSAETEHPAIGKLIDVDGVQVHYTDTGGNGDAIVLLHGNGSLVQDFACSGLIERLSANHRVIAFDRPGYGYTARPDDREWTAEAQAALFAAAARQIGVERPVVVGHSWGTLAALAWALNAPGTVEALVLLSGYYYPTLRPDAMALNISDVPVPGQIFTMAWAPLQARIIGPFGLKQVFSPAEVPQNFMDAMPFGLMVRPSQIRASAEDGAQMPANAKRLAERYDELDLPIAAMWGDGDKLVMQDDQSVRLVAELATASGTPTPGVGHMIHHSDPAGVAAAILMVGRRADAL